MNEGHNVGRAASHSGLIALIRQPAWLESGCLSELALATLWICVVNTSVWQPERSVKSFTDYWLCNGVLLSTGGLQPVSESSMSLNTFKPKLKTSHCQVTYKHNLVPLWHTDNYGMLTTVQTSCLSSQHADISNYKNPTSNQDGEATSIKQTSWP